MSDRCIDHPSVPDFWTWEPPTLGRCWVCGELTQWFLLDLGHQHPDCDMFPTEDGDVTIIGGVTQTIPIASS